MKATEILDRYEDSRMAKDAQVRRDQEANETKKAWDKLGESVEKHPITSPNTR